MGARVYGIACVMALAGCAASPQPSTPPPGGTSTPTHSVSPAVSVDPPAAALLTEIVLSPPISAFGPEWSEVFAVGYGDAPELLGTSLGGDGKGIHWGPSYGTQLPDGTWWFVDTGKLRLAHYSETGAYLGDLRLREEYLAQGQYLQWARPLALRDGTVVLQSTTPDNPEMLLLAPDGTLSRTPLDEWLSVHTTDGTYLYGFSDGGLMVRIDPRTGTSIPVLVLSAITEEDLRISLEPGLLSVTLGTHAVQLPVSAAGADGAEVHLGIEAAVGTDGVANILLSGLIEKTPGEVEDVLGLLRLRHDGRATIDDLPALTSSADPADGLRLGVRWGDHRPWLMLIGEDAVRVFRRTVEF